MARNEETFFQITGTAVGRLGRLSNMGRTSKPGASDRAGSGKPCMISSRHAGSHETCDTQNFFQSTWQLLEENHQEQRCIRKPIFAPAFALDYTSPAAQNAFSYQKVTTNPLCEAHEGKRTKRCLGNFPQGWKVTGIFFKPWERKKHHKEKQSSSGLSWRN